MSSIPGLPGIPPESPAPGRGNTPPTTSVANARYARMSLGGQNATEPTPEIQRMYPGQQWNYVTIPWCMSLPSRGCILLTSLQLVTLETLHRNDPATLTFTTYNEDNTEARSFSLQGMYLDRALPLYGSATGFYSAVPNNAEFADTPGNFDGLWAVYFTDDRAVRLFHPVFRDINVHDASGRRYWNKTTKETNGEHAPYTYQQVLQLLDADAHPEGLAGDRYSQVTSSLTPQNLSFRGIPATLATDLLLHQIGLVIHPDLRQPIGVPARYSPFLWGDTNRVQDIHGFIGSIRQFRISGGTQRRYAAPNIPSQLTFVVGDVRTSGWPGNHDPANGEAWSSDNQHMQTSNNYCTLNKTTQYNAPSLSVPKLNTRQVIQSSLAFDEDADPATALEPLVLSHSQKFLSYPGQMSFAWWWDDFLGLPGWSAITFSLNNGFPSTSIELAGIGSPMGMLSRRNEAAVKGDPIPAAVSSDGSTTWSMSSEGVVAVQQRPLFFLARVTSRDVAADTTGGTNLGVVKPINDDRGDWWNGNYFAANTTDEEIPGVWLWKDSWIDTNDPVLVFATGLKEPRWLAVGLPPVRVAGHWCAPMDCACEDEVTGCSACTTTAVDTDPQTPLAE